MEINFFVILCSNQCNFSSRNHFYSSFYSVYNEINSVLVQFLFFDSNYFSFSSIIYSTDHFSSSFPTDASNHFSSSFSPSFSSNFKVLELSIVQRQRFTCLFSGLAFCRQKLIFAGTVVKTGFCRFFPESY